MENDINLILLKHYSIASFKQDKMEGYASLNYKISIPNKNYVLKIYPFSENLVNIIEAENAVLKKLESLKAYDFPKIIYTQNSNELVIEGEYVYRLLSYVEGSLLAEVNQSSQLLGSLGKFLGQINLTLRKLENQIIKGIETVWDLRHFSKNKDFVHYIPDPKDRSLVNYFFLQYELNIRPHYYQLRCSIIHNDANDYNVLVRGDETSGIIDFGDMCYTWLINELAVALPYIMMNSDNPIKKALPLLQAYNREIALEPLEVKVLYYLIAARLCTSVCNSAYTKREKSNSSYVTISEKGAWKLLKKWLTINPLKAEEEFAKACNLTLISNDSVTDLRLKRKKHLSESLSLSYSEPIEMYQSAFQYMYSRQGDTYLDAYNNIMLVGHSHPDLIAAANYTFGRLNTNTRYLYPELTTYSKRLLAKFPQELNKVFFVNSGSAASDLAIRLARWYTKKEGIVGIEHGYHGNTSMGIAISHYKFQNNKNDLSNTKVATVPMPKIKETAEEKTKTNGSYLAKKAIRQLEETKEEIAAFIAEPIMGCGGQVPLPQGYLEEFYAFIRACGGVCISDEVQVGFGRLGDSFWGFQQHDIIPDIVILGKPMGNGHPIGAVVTTSKIAKAFESGPEFFSSFGGNPVSCAIGLSVLNIIEKEGLQKHAKEVGCFLKNALLSLSKKYPEIYEVRGLGLFLGIEFIADSGTPNTELAKFIKEGLKEKHILTSTDGPYNNVLKIKPPLSFSKTDATLLVNTIDAIMQTKREK